MLELNKKVVDHISSHYLKIDWAVYLYSEMFGLGWLQLSEEDKVMLKVMGYLDADYNLTPKAERIAFSLESSPKLDGDATAEEEFELFWRTYPKDDSIPGVCSPTRSFKTKKLDARLAFFALDVPTEELIKALRTDVQKRIQNSSFNRNQLTYMKNPANWLRDQEYLNIEYDLEDYGRSELL